MPSLKDFVSALQAGWFPALAALFGCSIIVFGHYFELPYLKSAPQLVLDVAIVVGVFSASILLATLVYLPIKIFQALAEYIRKAKKIKRLEREINDAPYDERAILAYLVSSGRKAFVARYDDRRLTPLVAKALILKLPGEHSVLEWPYRVNEDVWNYLRKNKDKFHFSLDPSASDPFHWRNSNI